jgi:hypothetical protein
MIPKEKDRRNYENCSYCQNINIATKRSGLKTRPFLLYNTRIPGLWFFLKYPGWFGKLDSRFFMSLSHQREPREKKKSLFIPRFHEDRAGYPSKARV